MYSTLREKNILFFLFLLTLLCAAITGSGCRSEKPPPPQQQKVKSPLPQQTQKQKKSPPKSSLLFEEPNLPQPETESRQEKPSDRTTLPRIAIIIDDMGYHEKTGNQLLALPLELTFSFLPQAPFLKEQQALAHKKERDILLHLPMEPLNRIWDPGPLALYLSETPQQIASLVEQNLAAVPGAIGSNNHMGSRFTEDRAAMHTVLSVLQKHNLFFIDSFTSSKSIAMSEARRMGIKTAGRQVFLDNVLRQENICRQLQQLVAIAKKQGWAIGIGHPNEATLAALTKCRETLLSQVRLVPVHELVK